jgi:hypothetical protein
MGRVLSIDLAYTTVRNVGICLLEEDRGAVTAYDFLQPSRLGLSDPPVPGVFAKAIHAFCLDEGISLLILDGPQGWKDPSSTLVHCRRCERILNAPAKTGIVGQVKPANYTRFVEFSIAIFANLTEREALLATGPSIAPPVDRLLVLESLPLSAWRKLKIPPLPAKARATVADCEERFAALTTLFRLKPKRRASHDELQALIAGLGGVAILGGNCGGYLAEGSPPFRHEGSWVEGFIVNPVMQSGFPRGEVRNV